MTNVSNKLYYLDGYSFIMLGRGEIVP